MKHRLCILLAFCMLLILAGCRRIGVPEEETGTAGSNYNKEAPAVDRDGEEDTGNVSGSFRGYETLADYLEVYGSVDNPILLEDVLPGGCLYRVIMQDGVISGIENCWVTGYVVGFINGTTWKKTVFGMTDAVASNVVLAAKVDETDMARCFPVQLAQSPADMKEIREALNLKDNPDMLGKLVCLAGSLTYYMHTLGLTQTYNGYYDDGNPEVDPQPDEPDTPDNPDPDDPDDPEPDTPSGPYHGYASPSTYITAFSQSYDKPAPFEDFLEGGCVYEDVAHGKKLTEWKKRPLWIRGFIVGYVYGTEMADAVFDVSELQGKSFSNTNVLIAERADETDYHRCLPIELPNRSQIRKALDLKQHPELVGTEVAVKGQVEKYFSVAGIKSPSQHVILSE